MVGDCMKNIIIGVGGIVFNDNKVLLVRPTYGQFKGKWIIPGGHVNPGENIDDAVLREVKEETRIDAAVKNIISLRSIILPDGNSEIYIVFLLDYISGIPISDGTENDGADFFNVNDVIKDENVVYLSRYLIKRVISGDCNKLSVDKNYYFSTINPDNKLFD